MVKSVIEVDHHGYRYSHAKSTHRYAKYENQGIFILIIFIVLLNVNMKTHHIGRETNHSTRFVLVQYCIAKCTHENTSHRQRDQPQYQICVCTVLYC